MSIRVMAQIWDAGPTNQSERFVLLALADFANDAGECWPAVAGVAKKCCMTDRGVRQILRRLEASGWIKTDVGGGRHGCSKYTINPEPCSAFPGDKPGTTFPPEPRSPRNDSAETRNDSVKNPEPRSAEPSRTIKEPSLKTREALVRVLSDQAADAFIAHRKAKRAKLTEHAAQLIARKLETHPDPDSVVFESIANGWTGVFPKNVNTGGSRDGSAADRAVRAAERWAARHGACGMDFGEDRNPPQPLLPAGQSFGSPGRRD